METFLLSIQYVTNGPYFWGSMGFIVASAMLIGTLIFGSNHGQIYKFLLGLFTYLIMLTFVNLTRAIDSITSDFTQLQIARAYASTITVFIVSFFWVLGLFLGMVIDKFKKHK